MIEKLERNYFKSNKFHLTRLMNFLTENSAGSELHNTSAEISFTNVPKFFGLGKDSVVNVVNG